MALHGSPSWFCILISAFQDLWTTLETHSWHCFGQSLLETVVCSLFRADGEPLSLVCPEVALEDCQQRTKPASFRCVLLSVSLGTDRWRRFLSSLDRKASCLSSCLISYHSVLENSKVTVLCQLAQRGDVRFDCFWRFLTSEMKLVRFIRFVCFTDTKIFKLLHDFPQVLHVSFLLELESIKYVHRVFSNSCQKYSALKIIRFLIKPARNSIILELAFELFPVMAKTSIGHFKFWWQRNICRVYIACFAWWITSRGKTKFFSHWMT